MSESKKPAIRVSAALIAFIVLFISVYMVWGCSSDWGKVNMQRQLFTYSTADGEYTGSVILMSPKTASSANKTPAVLILGGASSYSYALKAYGIELARRGYTVMLADMPGQGQSSFVGEAGGYGNYKATAGQPGGGEDVTGFTTAASRLLASMDFVDTDRMVIAGFSAGQSWGVQTAVNFVPGLFKTVGTLSGYTTANRDAVLAAGMNFFGVYANAAAVDPGYETVTNGVAGVGNVEEGTADYIYVNGAAVQHQMQPTTPSLILGTCKVLEALYPTDTTVDPDSNIFFTAEIFSGVAIIALFVLIACFLKALLSMKFFASLRREEPKAYPGLCEGSKGKAIAFLSARVLLTIVLYELLGARFQIIPLFAGVSWAGLWINIWVPFLVANMIVNAVIFVVWHRKIGAPNGGNAYNYGLSWGKDTAKNILKTMLLGLATVFVVISFLTYLDQLLTINLKVMIFGLISFNAEHMLQMPAYIILYFALLLTASFTQYITNPVNDDGTSRGQIVATVRTTLIAILPYLVLVVWNTFKGIGSITMAQTYPIDQFAPLDNMYGYPIMMSLVTPIMDMLRRKTKSVWPGIIVCAMLLGVLIACNYSLNASVFH